MQTQTVKCDICNDTGEKNFDGNLDCDSPSCSAAQDHAALNRYVRKLGPMIACDRDWMVFQYAISETRKKLQQELAQILFRPIATDNTKIGDKMLQDAFDVIDAQRARRHARELLAAQHTGAERRVSGACGSGAEHLDNDTPDDTYNFSYACPAGFLAKITPRSSDMQAVTEAETSTCAK